MIINEDEKNYIVVFENENDIIRFSNIFCKYWHHEICDYRNYLLERKIENNPMYIGKKSIYMSDFMSLLREEKLKRILNEI